MDLPRDLDTLSMCNNQMVVLGTESILFVAGHAEYDFLFYSFFAYLVFIPFFSFLTRTDPSPWYRYSDQISWRSAGTTLQQL